MTVWVYRGKLPLITEDIPEGDADAEEGGRDAEDFSPTGLLRSFFYVLSHNSP
jgi:hypothetical protein